MNILSEIKTAGLLLSMVGDQLQVANSSKLTAALRLLITGNKPEIIKQLTAAQIQHDIRDRLEDKPSASTCYCFRVTDKPKSILTVNSQHPTLAAAKQSLMQKYGARLIDCYPMPINY